MKRFRNLIIIGFAALSGLLNAIAAPKAIQEIWIVTGQNSGAMTITKQNLKELFLGTPTSGNLPSGVKAIDRTDTASGFKADLKSTFYENIVGRTLTQMKAYWSQLVFTGRGYPPPVAENVEDLRKLLNSSENAISYIEPSEMDSTLKVIVKLPLEHASGQP